MDSKDHNNQEFIFEKFQEKLIQERKEELEKIKKDVDVKYTVQIFYLRKTFTDKYLEKKKQFFEDQTLQQNIIKNTKYNNSKSKSKNKNKKQETQKSKHKDQIKDESFSLVYQCLPEYPF